MSFYRELNLGNSANQVHHQDGLTFIIEQLYNKALGELIIHGEYLTCLNASTKTVHESFKQLAYSFPSQLALQASAFVGRKVLVSSDSIKLNAQGASRTAVNVPVECQQLHIGISTVCGKVVRRITWKHAANGLLEFTWDGLDEAGACMPPGKYTLRVTALIAQDEVHLKTMTTANIDSVSLGEKGEGVKLFIAGVGEVLLDDKKMALNGKNDE